MKLRHLLVGLGAIGALGAHAQGMNRGQDAAAHSVQATCSEASGEKRLARLNEDYIEVRSGSATRPVALSDIESIDVTGPVNRISRVAWATVKTRAGDTESMGIALTNGGSVVLDGYSPEGKADSIDLLSCKRISFRNAG